MNEARSNEDATPNQKLEDEKINQAIRKHGPVNILHSTQQDFLAGYKIACVDSLGVSYTVQCIRKPDEILYTLTITGPNALSLKVDVNKAITCYNGLVFKAQSLKSHREGDL